MNDYDILFGVIIRLPSENGADINLNIDKITKRVGKALETEFKDLYVQPFGMELVEPDGKIRILNSVEYPVEPEEEEEDGDL